MSSLIVQSLRLYDVFLKMKSESHSLLLTGIMLLTKHRFEIQMLLSRVEINSFCMVDSFQKQSETLSKFLNLHLKHFEPL